MKVLLDECVPVDFRHSFPEHEVHSVEWAGYKGMKNGALLRAAEDDGYAVFLTADQGVPYQQSTLERKISIIVACAATNRIEDLLPLVPSIRAAMDRVAPGQVVFVR